MVLVIYLAHSSPVIHMLPLCLEALFRSPLVDVHR